MRTRFSVQLLLAATTSCVYASSVHADELGIRLNSAIPATSNALVQFPTGGDGSSATSTEGKMIHVVYDYEPHDNFYLEGGVGYRSWSDICEYSSMAYELSPGLRVTAGYFVMKLSEGIAYMPQNQFNAVTFSGYQKWDFVTHLTFGLRDPHTGIGLYLDRAHYSNGQDGNNPSLNYAGFMLQFPI